MKTTYSILVIGLASLAATSCNTIGNGPEQAREASERHPISVDQQTVTMTIAVDPSLNELSNVDKARLRSLIHTYTAKGHGPITVTAPSGSSGGDVIGQEVAADVRKELHALGLNWSQIEGATYRVSAAAESMDVVVSFSNYVATPSACGDWGGEVTNRFLNRPSNNFGCATQNNLAVMISDPRDLVAPQDFDAPDAGRRDTVIDLYRAGEATSSATESNEESTSDL